MAQYMYGPMEGATSSTAGEKGLVPKPAAGDQGKFLKGDGTWGNEDISGKQDKTDNSLDTTAKTVVGAINEHESDITSLNSKITDITTMSTSAGTFSTLAGLATILNTAVSSMNTYEIKRIRVDCSATVYPFTNGYAYDVELYKFNGNTYIHANFYAGGKLPIYVGVKDGSGWSFDELALNSRIPKNHGSFQCNVVNGRADITSADILSGTFPSNATSCFFSVVGFGTSVKQVYVCAGSSTKVTTFADFAQSITILWEEY